MVRWEGWAGGVAQSSLYVYRCAQRGYSIYPLAWRRCAAGYRWRRRQLRHFPGVSRSQKARGALSETARMYDRAGAPVATQESAEEGPISSPDSGTERGGLAGISRALASAFPLTLARANPPPGPSPEGITPGRHIVRWRYMWPADARGVGRPRRHTPCDTGKDGATRALP